MPVDQAIIQVALPVPLPQLFDYVAPDQGPQPFVGSRVLVPFGKRELVGVIAAIKQTSDFDPERLLSAIQVLDDEEPLLDESIMQLLAWCWKYYKHAPGEVLAAALPPALRKADSRPSPPPLSYSLTDAGRERLAHGPGNARVQYAMLALAQDGPVQESALKDVGSQWRKTLSRLLEEKWFEAVETERPEVTFSAGHTLTEEQQAACQAIVAEPDRFQCHLLDGVTGSGKTEVYLQVMEPFIARGQQVLLLVPEIGLTPQLIRRFQQRLGMAPAVLHSGLAAGARLQQWSSVRSGHAPVLIGTRSALFTPIPDLGLIILDEEHDASFKQQDGFRYSARDVAVKRAADIDIPIILGTATPSLESFHNALQGRYQWHRLRQRASQAPLPSWRVLDLKQQSAVQGLTAITLEAIEQTLSRGEQVMVFLNRRGYAPVLTCPECGWYGQCNRCDANLTWHRSLGRLCCHHCGSQRSAPRFCPECRADALVGAGEGTQQLEELLQKRFPSTPVLRFDRDRVSRKGALDALLEQVREGEPSLLIGTQMLAKGHHFPEVTLVVIVNIDQALYSADYRALERMGQMIQQVAGRAGRAEKSGTVILQTLHPEHEALDLLLSQGYEAYARWLLQDRQLAGLPPSGYQALLRAEAHERATASQFLEQARSCFPEGEARVFGPLPAIMERHSGRFRMYLVVLSNTRNSLHQQLDQWLEPVRKLRSARKVRWNIDVDPQEL